MKKSISLFTCMAFLIGAVAFEAPATDKAAPLKACCSKSDEGELNLRNNLATSPPFVCLQYPLYEDQVNNLCLWSGDAYEVGQTCEDYPMEVYFWTVCGLPGPEICDNCQSARFLKDLNNNVAKDPKIKKFVEGANYSEKAPKEVSIRDKPRTWDATEGLDRLGAAVIEYVKIPNPAVAGQFIYVKLFTGAAEFSRVKFALGSIPDKLPKIRTRRILIGFESDLPANLPEEPKTVTPKPWLPHKDCKTACTIIYRGETYFVTTETSVF